MFTRAVCSWSGSMMIGQGGRGMGKNGHMLPPALRNILITRASDLMTAHDLRLWETLQEFSQNLAIWRSRCMLLEQTGN